MMIPDGSEGGKQVFIAGAGMVAAGAGLLARSYVLGSGPAKKAKDQKQNKDS